MVLDAPGNSAAPDNSRYDIWSAPYGTLSPLRSTRISPLHLTMFTTDGKELDTQPITCYIQDTQAISRNRREDQQRRNRQPHKSKADPAPTFKLQSKKASACDRILRVERASRQQLPQAPAPTTQPPTSSPFFSFTANRNAEEEDAGVVVVDWCNQLLDNILVGFKRRQARKCGQVGERAIDTESTSSEGRRRWPVTHSHPGPWTLELRAGHLDRSDRPTSYASAASATVTATATPSAIATAIAIAIATAFAVFTTSVTASATSIPAATTARTARTLTTTFSNTPISLEIVDPHLGTLGHHPSHPSYHALQSGYIKQ
ncbi:hypothetical protein C1H76_7524 [Elsinoe australis]|uniref:Uncharacterized protein n=1 Tax=Elsinoe australis TaxID=40998 RepID=A0A4U7AUI0_9PEZI|nr:hypothetical protein C1H76_7524 [Elsinoe australis]